ncbi:unnamed protein product, partial [Ectocarpus fasciculatus]
PEKGRQESAIAVRSGFAPRDTDSQPQRPASRVSAATSPQWGGTREVGSAPEPGYRANGFHSQQQAPDFLQTIGLLLRRASAVMHLITEVVVRELQERLVLHLSTKRIRHGSGQPLVCPGVKKQPHDPRRRGGDGNEQGCAMTFVTAVDIFISR